MSEKIKNLEKELLDAHPDRFIPRFTYNNEIVKRGIGTGDYQPLYDMETSMYKFQFNKKIGWDNELSFQLMDMINKSEMYKTPLVTMPSLIESMEKYTSLPRNTFDNNFVILENSNKEDHIYNIDDRLRSKEYIPNSVLGAETREEALEKYAELIKGFVNENSIIADPELIEYDHQLIEDIGKTFFGAKTE